MKVVLVRVPEDFSVGVHEVFVQYEALGLGYVAAMLRKHEHQVTILDGTLLDVTPDLKDRLEEPFKRLLADLYLEALAAAPYGQLNATEGAWLVRKVYLAQQILQAEPDLVGFSLVSSLVYGRVGEMVELLRDLGLRAPICAGGEQAALYAEDVLSHVPGLDACIKGEGEEACLELVQRLDDRNRWKEIPGLIWREGDRIRRNPDRPLVHDLDALPFAARDWLPELLRRGGETVISASRGCWGKCTFCSIIEFFDHKLGAAWRARSPENIAAELRHLYETYGADRFWFVDDEFFNKGEAGRLRAEEVFRRIAAARLPIRFDIFCRAGDFAHYGPRGTIDLAVEAGLRRALIGIESGSKEALKLFNKGSNPQINRDAIREGETRGVDVLVEFIMLNPWTTISQIEENLEFLKTVHRGPHGALGKYDPMVLASSLYIHRETPLGREFIQNWPELRDTSVEVGDDFYVPYKFQCPRVGALHNVISNSWECFAPVIQALEQLYRLVDRFWLPDWTDRPDAGEVRQLSDHYSAVLEEIRGLLNEEALAFFEETLALVKTFDLEGDTPEERERKADEVSDAVYAFTRRMTFEAEHVATYVYSQAVPVLAEVWEVLGQYGLRGKRVRPPSVLIREMPERYRDQAPREPLPEPAKAAV